MSKYSRVLILPSKGVLLYGFWRAVILMIYSVDGLRPEEILYFSQTVTKCTWNKRWNSDASVPVMMA